MEKKKKKPDIHYRPAPTKLKIVLCILILSSMLALAALAWVHAGLTRRTQELTQEAADAEYRREDLQDKIENLDSVDSVRDIAQEELGLVDPNTIIINPKQE